MQTLESSKLPFSKAIYHSNDAVCIWVLKTRDDRNRFVEETAGMMKSDREKYYA
ncbi:hypothetical protein HOB87_04690 [Candidatus Woesearchaeota archaeon]|nr:hypothetical protein [Candidatus Woesearchaeota archaeon]